MTLSDSVMELAARVGGEFKATSGRIDALDALVEEADAPQTLSGQGTTITLSDGGGSITMPSSPNNQPDSLMWRNDEGQSAASQIDIYDTPTEPRHTVNKAHMDDAIGGLRADTSLHPNPAGQGLNYMDFFTAWDSREEVSDAWTQGFSVNEDTEEIYVAAYSTSTYAQWIECRDYDGVLKWRTDDIPVSGGAAWSEGCPYFYDGDDLCFIVRIDTGGFIRTYNTVTEELSSALPVAGRTKLFGDDEYFYCADGDPTLAILTAVHVYSMESVKNGSPVLVNSIQLDTFGPQPEDNKPQGLAVRDGFIYVSAGKRDQSVEGTGRLDLRVHNPMGRIMSAVVLDKADYYRVLEEQKRPQDVVPNYVSFENEGVYPLRDGRVLTMNHIHRHVFITAHGVGGSGRVKAAASPMSVGQGWRSIPLSAGVTPHASDVVPSYYRDGAKVYIRGAFKGAPKDIGSSFALGRIPRGFRPAVNEQFLMPSNGTAYWRGYVETNGNVRVVAYGGGTLGPSSWLPLSFSYIADGLVI